ncbi:MAG: hypothetical protein IJ933_01510 [Bacteroidales bacterium]|nr:hypothetical protein [Bacteroidales bacterium]
MTVYERFQRMLENVNPEIQANKRKSFERMDDEQRETVRQEIDDCEFHIKTLESDLQIVIQSGIADGAEKR